MNAHFHRLRNSRLLRWAIIAASLLSPIIINAMPMKMMISATQQSVTDAPLAAKKLVSLGGFNVLIPAGWTEFSRSDAKMLRDTFDEQSKAIYESYSGASDATRTVDIVAFHIDENATFSMVVMSVPPQANLIRTLKEEAPEKAAWGVREGYIKRYLGLVPVEYGALAGFYTKAVGNSGSIELSGGLEHSARKNTLIQLTLLTPQIWNMDKASQVLTELMRSVKLAKIGK
jgi:hypothetical protein